MPDLMAIFQDRLGRIRVGFKAPARDEERLFQPQTDEGIELRVTSDDPAVVARIKGLGFFGLMASQDHHREHHLMMALGDDAHAH